MTSTIPYEAKFATDGFVFCERTFARGCGNDWVGDQGILRYSVSGSGTGQNARLT
jgi:hypothetical protein